MAAFSESNVHEPGPNARKLEFHQMMADTLNPREHEFHLAIVRREPGAPVPRHAPKRHEPP